MKAFIVGGAGLVGSCTADSLLSRGIADEIVLQDLNQDMAKSHAMDFSQAYCSTSGASVSAGGWDAAEGSDIVIIAAGLSPNKMSHDNLKDITAMLPIIDSVCEGVNKYCPGAVVFSLTNPLDIFNYVLYKRSGLASRQFIGLAANDSIRLRFALSEYFNKPVKDIEAYVTGEHGAEKINLFSTVKVCGKSVDIPEADRKEITARMGSWWSEFLAVSGNRTAGWTTGAYAAETVEHVFSRHDSPICVSAIIEEGLAIGYPAYLDNGGFVKTLQLKLSDEENKQLERLKGELRNKIQNVVDFI